MNQPRVEGAGPSLSTVLRLRRLWGAIGCLLAFGAANAAGCSDSGPDAGQGGAATSREDTAEAAQALTAAPVCIAIQRGLSGIVDDTQIVNKLPATTFGTSTVGNTGLVAGTERQLLIRFDLSAIPA